MSAYEPNSRHLREVLIFCFNMKKSAAEAHRMLSNTYAACKAKTEGISASHCDWAEKWVRYDNPKRRKPWGYPGHASTSTAKPSIQGSKAMLSIWWDQLGVVYYELLKPTETITGDRYRTQLMRLRRALKNKRPQYNERHDKVILQHDSARPHVAKVIKTYLETLKWEVLPHPLCSPDLAPSDYHLFRSMAHGLADQHLRSYEEVKNWIASKDNQFFQRGIRTLPERWEKVVASDGQYFES
ncbi:mariner Mos1 transposase [Trichonephila clavipes]|nr:mariner Mos1 transposase [Trichonephila clavipes]